MSTSKYASSPFYGPFGERGVPDSVIDAFADLEDLCVAKGEPWPPPPWAYKPYGRLKQTPKLPHQTGYVAGSVTAEDIQKITDELTARHDHEQSTGPQTSAPLY